MKRTLFDLFGLFCCCVNLLYVAAEINPNIKGNRRNILRKTFGELLDLSPETGRESDKRPVQKRTIEFYMKQLFEKYKRKSDYSSFNVVKSIIPRIEHNTEHDSLIFDIPSFQGDAIKAEIHVDYPWSKNLGARVRKTQNRPKNGSFLHCQIDYKKSDFRSFTAEAPLKSVTMGAGKSDWHIFDLSQILSSSQRNSDFIHKNSTEFSGFPLMVRFWRESATGSAKFASSRKITHRYNPFLLLYAFERQSGSIWSKGMDQIFDNAQNNSADKFLATNPHQPTGQRARRHAIASGTANDRLAVSSSYNYYAYNGNIVENPPEWGSTPINHVIKNVETFSKQGPSGTLEDEKEARRKRKKFRQRDDDRADGSSRFRNGFSRPAKNRKFAPRDDRKKESRFVNASKSSRGMANGGKVLKNAEMLVLLGKSKAKSSKFACRKHDMVVEFADIGWADFIVAPTSFDAHYCAGSCAFPLSKSSNPSNHAVIQSIIHAVGLHPGVPEISCAPDKMDSLTLLYYDKRNNLVLKNYPKMTVESCSCL